MCTICRDVGRTSLALGHGKAALSYGEGEGVAGQVGFLIANVDSGDNVDQPPLMTYPEAAELLAVKLGTLYFWVATKRVPHVRLSKRMVRFNRAELEKFIADRRVAVAAPGGRR